MDEPPFEQRSVSQMSLYIEKRQRRKPTDLKGLCAREVVRLLRSKQQEIDSLAETVPAELLALLWSWDELPDLTFTHWEHAQGDTPLPQGSRKLYHDERKPAGGWALPCSAYKEFFRLLLVHTKRSPTESYSSHVPRGIPDDASTFVQSCAFRCSVMHHPSWLTFEELLHGDAIRVSRVQKAKAKDEKEVRGLVKKMYQRSRSGGGMCVTGILLL